MSGYEDWAAGGKKSSGATQVSEGDYTPAFKDIALKSTKKSKTTGKSPQDTAVENFLEKIQKQIQDHADKAAKTQAAAENKAADQARKDAEDAIAHPEKAINAQKAQWDQAATMLKAMWATGNIPSKFTDLTIPDVGTASVKLDQPQEGKPAPMTAGEKSQMKQYVPPSGAAMGGTQTTDSVSKLANQMAVTQSKIDAANKAVGSEPFDWMSPTDWGGEIVNEVSKPLSGAKNLAARATDVLSRPMYGVTGFLDPSAKWFNDWFQSAVLQHTATPNMDKSPDLIPQYILDPTVKPGEQNRTIPNPVYNADAEEANRKAVEASMKHPGLLEQGVSGALKGVTGEKKVSGKQLLLDAGVPDVPVLTDILGYIAETGLDPTTYTGLGIGRLAEQFGLRIAPRAFVDLENEALRAGIKTGSNKLTTVALSAKADRQSGQIVKDILAGKPPTIKIGGSTEIAQHAADVYAESMKLGLPEPEVRAAVRHDAVQEILAEAAHQKYATTMERLVKNNKSGLDVQFAGHHFNPENPLINVPYQAANKLVKAGEKSKIGQTLAEAFSTKYWFPGETHTLHNKANSMGVADFQQKAGEVIDNITKKTNKADRKRLAENYEKGISLAGQKTSKGVDFGDLEKYIDDFNHQLYEERSNILGKFTPEVPNFTFHYYNAGSPEAIKSLRTTRDARLHAGATGDKRFTLEEAKKAGLKPTEEMDKIMVQQLADHQRQMVNESFHRMMTETYGHWTDNPVTAHHLGLVKVQPPKSARIKKGMDLYMDPKIKKVYDSIGRFGTRSAEESNRITRLYDRVIRDWKVMNTTMRPGHHIRNLIGDVYMNYLDGVTNPYRYRQAMQMIRGDRSKLRLRVGNQVLNGDQIYDLWRRSGASQGFISSEIIEGKNPLARGLNEFSQNRELFARYAHFMDSLAKDGKAVNLGINNKVGLMKLATDAGKKVNKWNLNYSDLTPFETSTMKRIVPFYTWTRKALPLLLESMVTHPGRVTKVEKINNLISNIAGVDPFEMNGIPVPQWMKEAGFARLNDNNQPNLVSLPFPTQDLGRWFGGANSVQGVAKVLASNINPITQMIYEQATGRNAYTGAQVPDDLGQYATGKLGVIGNIKDALGMGTNTDWATRVNALTGFGVYKDNEKRQLGELRRQQDPLNVQMAIINEKLGNYAVHKLKYGYSVYNKRFKTTEKTGFSNPEDAITYAVGLKKKDDEAIKK